jgi:REP element-mobilizing transposase RayT
MNTLPKRKHTRLSTYDYSENGVYFLTICTLNRIELLCEINFVGHDVSLVRGDPVGRDDLSAPSPLLLQPEVSLTKCGEIVKETIEGIPRNYDATVDCYCIMPNHVHLLIQLCGGASSGERPTMIIPKIIKSFKYFSNKQIGFNIWQRSYYDHIIRNEKDYITKCDYINNNPAKWADDDYYPQ